MKKILMLLLVLITILTLVSCSGKKEQKIEKEQEVKIEKEQEIEYDYSMIKTHASLSAGMTMPYDIDNLTEWSDGFIEFVVLSEPEEVTFKYGNQESDFAGENMTFPQVAIQIENIFYEKEGANLKEYDKIWLAVDALNHPESFIPGARFAAYVQFMNDPFSPMDLYIDSFFYYIDENDNLIPFTDDPSLMQYKDYSVEKMADLTVEANAAIKARVEEK